MKKLILAALAVMVGFASCSKDSEGTGPDDKAKNAIVNVRISADAFSRGAFDQIDNEATGVIQGAVSIKGDIYVFIAQNGNLLVKETIITGDLDGSNKTTAYTHETGSATKLLTTDIDQVIILANVPTIDLNSVSTVADLKAITKDLSNAQTDYLADNGGSGKIWVQGESGVTWGPAGTDGVVPGSASVSLNPVLSRIDARITLSDAAGTEATGLYTSKADFDARTDKTKGGVVLDNVSVLYSAKTSTWVAPFTPSTGVGNVLYSGIVPQTGTAWVGGKFANADVFNSYVGTKESFLFAEWNGTEWFSAANPNNTNGLSNYDTSSGRVFQRSFYAFSPKNYPASTGVGHFISDATDYKAYTMLTIKGTQYNKNGDEITPRYFSVVFAPAANGGDTTEELQPGNRYAVNLVMKGDFSNGGGGTTTPEEKGSANLTIEIKPAQWKTVITINKDFGPNS